ncbi:MAG: tetratricopeptide repeat protein [bacterium]
MSKKKHHKDKKKSKKVDLTKIPLTELEKNARLYLENNQYKKAIENYKAICAMKQGDNEVALHQLMRSYEGRVKELGLKGMHHESIELYEHVKRVHGKELDICFYIQQLFLVQNYPKAVTELYAHRNKFSDPKQLHKLESIVALLILAETPGIRELIPPESIIVKHNRCIEEALLALFSKQEDRIGEILKPIGVRSSCRDWKAFIKGLVAFYHYNDEEAADIFQRMPGDSPIACILPLFHSIICSAHEPHLSSLLPEETHLLNKIVGTHASLLSLSIAFTKACQSNNHKEMLKIVTKMSDHLPPDADKDRELLRQSSVHIMLNLSQVKGTSLGSLLKSYESLWGDTLPLYERYRIEALFYENQRNWDKAIDTWEACLDELKHNRAEGYPTRQEKDLAIAQILRRIADHCPKENPLENIFHAMLFGKKLQHRHDYISYLTESVKFDPTEKEIYEKIIQFYKTHNNQKHAQKWTEKLLHVFPDNSDALLSLSKFAFQRKAFQKARQYLDKLLQFDPLNEKALHQKITIHIHSARERITKKKFTLARKDFQIASSLSYSPKRRGTVHIIWGIAEIAMEDEEKGHALIQEGLQSVQNDTFAYFYTLLEGVNWHISGKTLSAYFEVLEKRLEQKPSIKDVSNLITLPFAMVCDNQSLSPPLRKEMKIIGPYLEKAMHHLTFSEEELLDICHYLASAQLYPLLLQYARCGTKKYSRNPRFLFFSYIGRNKGVFKDYDCELEDELLDIQDLCVDRNDHRTACEIEDFMDKRHPFYTRNPHEREQVSIFKPVVPLNTERPKETQPKPPKSKPAPRSRQLPLFGPGAEGV